MGEWVIWLCFELGRWATEGVGSPSPSSVVVSVISTSSPLSPDSCLGEPSLLLFSEVLKALGILSYELLGVKKGETLLVRADGALVKPVEEVELALELGGLSPTLRRFLLSGPQLSAALMALYASSAVIIRLAMAASDRWMLLVFQSVGPS